LKPSLRQKATLEVKNEESKAELEILQKILVRENILSELQVILLDIYRSLNEPQ
jgi:hypothetical protein